jgi:hypothetical protein
MALSEWKGGRGNSGETERANSGYLKVLFRITVYQKRKQKALTQADSECKMGRGRWRHGGERKKKVK